MRRTLAMLTVLTMGLTACTQDPPPSDPAPTSSPEADPTPTTAAPDPSEADDPSDEPSESEGPDASDEPTATESPTDEPSATETETEAPAAGGPLGTWDRSPAERSGGTRFTSTPALNRAWSGLPQGRCQVAAGTGETINECVSVKVRSKDGTLTVTDTTDGSGARTVRVFRTDSAGNNVSTLMADGAASRLQGTAWPSGDGLIAVTFDDGRYVIGWEGAEPASVADLGPLTGAETLSFTAGHIVRRANAGHLEVLNPGTNSSSGISVSFNSEDPPPTDVALRVYVAWITGDFAAMNGLATDKVIAALRQNRTTSDLFTLSGGQCSLASTQATCTFTSSVGNSTWTLERVGSSVQVVKLA